jgi:hypothetical protein
MSSVDSLPGDQRAVLQLVLRRGRSYEEIARLLSINPSAVRERALAALDSLGPQTKVPPERRAMIADYLLGQLPEADLDEVRDLLARSPSERAWARVLSSELAPMASGPLPEIPVEAPPAPEAAREPSFMPADPEPPPTSDPEPASPAAPVSEPVGPASEADTDGPSESKRRRRSRRSGAEPTPKPVAGPRSSRTGGMVVIGVAVVVVAVVVFLLLRSGGSNKPQVASTPTTTTTTSSAAASATSTTSAGASSTTSTSAKVLAQINLAPPKSGSKAAGIAEILSEGSTDGIAIVAQNVPANATQPPNAYAVWLYNSPTDAKVLGFVNPGVGKTGRLSTAGALPTNAKHFKNLIVTLETTASPKQPGTIVLQGALTGL